jgi:hypothetical protein
MKIALCFIISYDHILNKENVWRDWIEQNKDIINVYFYYKDITKIKSHWMLEHVVPEKYIKQTSYFHVIPAYMSIMRYAFENDTTNQWFCLLTDSCCPIISPKKFKYLFYKHCTKSILSWKGAWWNINFHKRANLALLPADYRLANDPWFVLKREDVQRCLLFIQTQQKMLQTVCKGGLANESLFAIILYHFKQLKNVVCSVTHIADWSRMASPTSPHIFKLGDDKDIQFIEHNLKEHDEVMFIRKIAPEFPDEILHKYIYQYSKEADDALVLQEPTSFKKLHIIANIIVVVIIVFFFVIGTFKFNINCAFVIC